MEPHQKHYREKMKSRGWMTQSGKLAWPTDEKARYEMARGLLGLELVSDIDNWVLLAMDKLHGTFEAPWAKQSLLARYLKGKEKLHEEAEKTAENEVHHRQALATLTDDQKEEVEKLLRDLAKGILFSICCSFDQFQGGRLSIDLNETPTETDPPIRIHPGRFLDLLQEQLRWLEEFSIVFGDDNSGDVK